VDWEGRKLKVSTPKNPRFELPGRWVGLQVAQCVDVVGNNAIALEAMYVDRKQSALDWIRSAELVKTDAIAGFSTCSGPRTLLAHGTTVGGRH